MLLFNNVEILVFRAEWLAIFDRLPIDLPNIVDVWERNLDSLFLPRGQL